MPDKTKTYTASYRLDDRDLNIYLKATSFEDAETQVRDLAAFNAAFSSLKLEGVLAHSELVHFQSRAKH